MHKILSAAVAMGLMAAGAAQAGTTTASFNVTATVLSNCVTSATNLAFPNYTPGAGAKSGSSTISVNCTKGTGYTVALNAGTTTGTAFTQRLLASGANTLQYNLFKDAAFTTVFGDGTGSSQTATGTGAGMAAASATSITVYGQLPDSVTNQAATPGTYADTITVTVTY